MACHEQTLTQHLLALVLRQVQLVEAGVCTGQAARRAIRLVDLELLGPANALQRLEALQGHLACAGDELDHERQVLLAELRQHLEEPPDNRSVGIVALVLCVGTQVCHIDVWQARDEQLQLVVVEDGDEVPGHQLPEALQERVDLLLDGGGHVVACDQVHVLPLVGLRDLDLAAAGNQLLQLFAAEEVTLRSEGEVRQNIGDVIL
mmetsp:Transcript_25144/g.68340  ORF Transcript_25144/g.68340 Transcript_25144/m.68340 type:complete len:205 (-) Transcript_25144:786-1400(-)